jgi:hypothetical protein
VGTIAAGAVGAAEQRASQTIPGRATLGPGSLLRQGEFERFFVLPRVYTYRSADRWAHSADAPVAASSAARLRHEGFRLALSEHLRAWHGVGVIRPFKPGWYATSTAIELASPEAARAEVRAMIRDDQRADSTEQVADYRPFGVPGIPGAHGHCVGQDCRVIYTIGHEVHVLTAGWREGDARAMTVGRSLLDRMRIAAARQFARLRRLY